MLKRGWAKAVSGPEDHGGEIPLVETIESLRAQLSELVAVSSNQEIQFPIDGVDLEFHVGVTRGVSGTAGVRFWIVELGANGAYEAESIHKVKVSLGAPVDAEGQTVKVRRILSDEP